MVRTMNLVLTGASGYLGQHLLSQWIRHGVLPNPSDNDAAFRITALYHSSEGFPEAVLAFRAKHETHRGIADVVVRSVDLTDPGDAVRSIVGNGNGNEETVVVHAAALSSPRACQESPELARALNVPKSFLDAFLVGSAPTNRDDATATGISRVSILALSTDQVYDGTQNAGSYYKEDEKDGLNPKNLYAETKLELERYLLDRPQTTDSSNTNSNHQIVLLAALRLSIVLGPKAPIDPGSAHGTFLDFCQSRGAAKEATTFFTNEYRSVVRVDKVVNTLGGLISKIVTASATASEAATTSTVVYNIGGPVRVNRIEMAQAVFDKFGYDSALLIGAEQTCPTRSLDVSMDSSLLFDEGILRDRETIVDSKTYLKKLVDYVYGAVE